MISQKKVALTYCDEVDPIAKLIGAVNYNIRQPTDGKLFRYNTDYIGAISSTETGLRGFKNGASSSPLASKLFVVIGTGGAGKALAFGAKEKGARVVNANYNYGEQNQGTSPRQKHNSNTLIVLKFLFGMLRRNLIEMLSLELKILFQIWVVTHEGVRDMEYEFFYLS